MTEPLSFKNFFNHYYILDFDSKSLSETDQKVACAVSIILGVFTLGLVHAGCAIAKYCIKPVEIDKNEKREEKNEDKIGMDAHKADEIRKHSMNAEKEDSAKNIAQEKSTQVDKKEERKTSDIVRIWVGDDLYCSRSGNTILGSARQSQIEALGFERRSPSPSGKGDEEDQFGKVAASPNLHFLAARSIEHGFYFEVAKGDLLAQEVDAIVNPANSSLGGGGGLDAKFEAKAGRAIYKECRAQLEAKGLEKCQTGDAYITGPGNLKNVKHVIHAVGPRGDSKDREEKLRKAYYNGLLRAHENNLTSIAFPAISIGIFSYPPEEAPKEIWKAVCDFQKEHPDSSLKTVRIVYWTGTANDRKSYQCFLELINAHS